MTIDKTAAEVDKMMANNSQELERLCLGGHCSKNYISSYKFGKEVLKMLIKVQKLIDEGNSFDKVAVNGAEALVVERPSEF